MKKGNIVYVVGKPYNIYRLRGNPMIIIGFPRKLRTPCNAPNNSQCILHFLITLTFMVTALGIRKQKYASLSAFVSQMWLVLFFQHNFLGKDLSQKLLLTNKTGLPLLQIGLWNLTSTIYPITSTVSSRFKKARFKKDSQFKKDCCYNRFFST